jgi:phage tail sheath protein FI
MPQYLAPGVYVEEVPGTPPIPGVGTSTAGFVGEVDPAATNPDGKVFEMPFRPGRPLDPNNIVPADRYELALENQPVLVTNWEQFKIHFGDFHAGNSTLAHAVFGFFNNGGTTCWVTRVADLADATGVGAALKGYEAIDEIAIVAAPGALNDAVQLAVIEHCENLKDRFAIIDGQATKTITPAAIKGPVGNSDYAALYFPRILVFDAVARAQIPVFASGHLAGIYARVDQTRGVHKAPANEVVRGALGLEYLVSRNEQELLNPVGINVIRNFNGNLLVWGARTLGGDANGETKYINVRRLLNFLRESIDEGTQFAVFEPNARPLWQRITRSVTAFLTNVWRDGALFGAVPEQAFYVKCDETTNTADVRALGQVVTEVGVAVVQPAEFVIFRIAQMAGPTS